MNWARHSYQPPTMADVRHVSHLSLTNFESHPAFAAFVAACRSLQSLRLANNSTTDEMEDILTHVPATLTSLSLGFGSLRWDLTSITRHLPRLSHLTSLAIEGARVYHGTFFAHLSHVPLLASLTLGRQTSFLPSDLLSFISGSTRHPSLRRLTLDNFVGKRGFRIGGEGEGWMAIRGPALSRINTAGWRILPQHAQTAVEQLVRAGAAIGVVVDGSTVDAMAVAEEWKEEEVQRVLFSARSAQEQLRETRRELGNLLGDEEAATRWKAMKL